MKTSNKINYFKNMQIYIKALNGESFPLKIESNDLIKDIKMKIQDKEGIPFDQQNLTYLDENLLDDKSIKDYFIPDNGIIIVSLKSISQSIEINIRTQDGTGLTFKIESSARISDLKNIIETKANVPSNRQKLYFNDQELFNINKLSDYSITNNSQITLVICTTENMTLFINTLSAKLIPIEIKPSDQIEIIKEMIQKVKQIQINRQRLFFNQKELENFRTIEDYSIPNDSILTLIPRSKSGMKIVINSISTGKILALDVDNDDRIDYIKEKIQFFGGCFIYQQRLTYAGILLEDHFTLEDYLIPKNATIELALFVKGGNLIFVRTVNGRYVPFEVETNDSILMLKKEIEKKFDVPFDQLDFYYRNQELEDDKTFQDYSIQNESIIQMKLKMPENMFVCIKSVKGEKVIIDVQPTEKVEKVKTKIKEILNIEENQQRLIFDGQQLDDNLELFDYSITNGSEILLAPLIKSRFQIFIKIKCSQKFSIDVDKSFRIKDVKEIINEKEGIDINKQRLFMDNKQLDDDKSLESLSIKKDSILNLIVISEDGMMIFVKTNKSKYIPLEVHQSDLIEDIKKQINEKEGLLIDHFDLFVFDKRLDVAKKIQDYDIKNGQSIFLATKLDGSLKLFVKFNNERIPIDVEPNFSIEDVKNQILYKRGIPIENQKLIFDGKTLENDKKIQDYSIEGCSLLDLNL